MRIAPFIVLTTLGHNLARGPQDSLAYWRRTESTPFLRPKRTSSVMRMRRLPLCFWLRSWTQKVTLFGLHTLRQRSAEQLTVSLLGPPARAAWPFFCLSPRVRDGAATGAASGREWNAGLRVEWTTSSGPGGFFQR